MAADENMPAVKHHRDREFSGMFEYRKEEEPHLIRNLIIGKAYHIIVGSANVLDAIFRGQCIFSKHFAQSLQK